MILGLLPLGSTLYISTLDSTVWSTQYLSTPGVLEYLGEYLEYLSTRVLSLSLDTKLKLIRNTVERKIAKVPKIVGCQHL